MDQSYDAVITRMQKYIKNTPESESLRFGLGFAEFCALRDILAKDMIADAFFLAFSYGRAKGYRLARFREERRLTEWPDCYTVYGAIPR